MERLFAFLGATIAGSAGWWIGAFVGVMTAFFFSVIASGAGLYLGRRIARHYLG